MTRPVPGRTQGWLLDGTVRYDQLADGYRTGIEPVLLAAFIPARPGQRVLEAGCGAGAALLCLAARVPGVVGLGIERNPDLAALAAANAAANPFATGLQFREAAIEPQTAASLGGPFHHAMANPPWHDAGGTPSAIRGRREAKIASGHLLATWVATLAACLEPGGSLTLILPASQLAAAIPACAGNRIGSLILHPFWPRPGRPAKLCLLRGRRFGKGATQLLPGLVLHGEGATYTPAADRVLRGGRALPDGAPDQPAAAPSAPAT